MQSPLGNAPSDKMHDNPLWETFNKHQKLLELCAPIERVVMKQTGEEYQPCNLVNHILTVLTMKQPNNAANAANAQWYKNSTTE